MIYRPRAAVMQFAVRMLGVVKARHGVEQSTAAVVNARHGLEQSIINTSYQKLPFGSGDYPDKLLFHQALN